MYRRGGVIALVALALAMPAAAQAPQAKDEPTTAKPPASTRDDERPRKPRPSGGGATSGASSKGGNAGTPSGSFTGPAAKP